MKDYNGLNKDMDGIGALYHILRAINENFGINTQRQGSERRLRKIMYPDTQIIYRGITKDHEGCEKNKCWYIRSGLSVRIRTSKTPSETLNKAEYIKNLRSLISDARKLYPQKYTPKTPDLEVLADIQHNGGATCLVDFSRNILTSLWFACNNDYESDGYLFCYNITEDAIYNNSLSILTQEECRKPIRDLLVKTYRLVDACSVVTDRFCLWDPALINSRIARQDSVFLFGIEQFKVSDMSDMTMMKITIPYYLKRPICSILKSMFCIKSSSIYNDPVGFATANSKSNSLDDAIKDINERYYTKAFKAMLAGYYAEAIELFNSVVVSKNDLSLQEQIEINFSLGVCYKKLQRKNILYKRNAILAYEKAIDYTLKYWEQIDRSSHNDFYEYYVRKLMRSYNEIIELCYNLSDYDRGIRLCHDVESFIRKETAYCFYDCKKYIHNNFLGSKFDATPKGCGKKLCIDLIREKKICKECAKIFETKYCKKCNYSTTKCIKKELNLKYCKLVELELSVLDMLKNNSNRSSCENVSQIAENSTVLNAFDILLFTYYQDIIKICLHKYNDGIIRDIEEKIEKCLTDSSGYFEWNFVDIKKAIENITPNLAYAQKQLYELTTHIISARDKIQSKHDSLYRKV